MIVDVLGVANTSSAIRVRNANNSGHIGGNRYKSVTETATFGLRIDNQTGNLISVGVNDLDEATTPYSDAGLFGTTTLRNSNTLITGALEIDGALNHDGTTVGFYGTTPIAKQTGVAVTAAGIHAALVALGLISA